MPSVISASNSDQYISMTSSMWARSIFLPTDWTKIRVGCRFRFSDTFPTPGQSPTGTPRFAFGLCSGTTNIMGDSNTTYFFGAMSNSATWPNAYGYYDSTTLVGCIKTGSTFITSANITSDWRPPGDAGRDGLFLVDITKGSPNYIINVYSVIAANPNNFASSKSFANALPLTLIDGQVPNHKYGTAQTMAIDEVASGSLNAVSCWFDKTAFRCYIEDLGVAILQRSSGI